MNHPVRISLALLCLSAFASAQDWGDPSNPNPCLSFDPENRIDWNATTSPGVFRRAVALELDGDDSTDAVVLADGQAVALFDVAYNDRLETITVLGEDVEDVAVLESPSPTGCDMLLATNEVGLVSTSWTGAQFEFASPTTIAAGSWVSARTLHVDDIDGDGYVDIVGITADGLTVLTRMGSSTGFAAGFSYTPGAQVYDAVSVYWNHSQGRGLAVVTAAGLKVYRAGSQIRNVNHAAAFGCIARVRADIGTTTTGELLAWARPASGGGAELAVFNGVVTESPQALAIADCSIGSVTPHAIVAGHYDKDDYDELLVVSGNSRAIVLRNKAGAGASHFDPSDAGSYDTVPLTSTPTSYSGTGIPAFAQLDSYDELDPYDLVVPVNGVEEIVVFRTLSYQRTDAGTWESPDSKNVFPAGAIEFTTSEVNAAQLRVGFKVLGQYWELYERVLVKIWSENYPNAGLNTQAYGNIATYHSLIRPIDEQDEAYQWTSVTPTFPDGAYWSPDQTHFYVELRFQRPDGQGGWKNSPKFFGVFTLPDHSVGEEGIELTDLCFHYACNQAPPGDAFVVLQEDLLTGGLDAGTLVGAYVPIDSLPSFNGTPQGTPQVQGNEIDDFNPTPD